MSGMMLIDSHCHLYAEEFAKDLEEVLQRSEASGVKKFYLPAIDSTTHSDMLKLENEHPQCVAMMGLHPCSVNANYERELQISRAMA